MLPKTRVRDVEVGIGALLEFSNPSLRTRRNAMDPAKVRGREAECAERSFGVRAACCRFCLRQLAGGWFIPRASRP